MVDPNIPMEGENVSNQYSSISAASSGDFHKYRKDRRAEIDRLEALDETERQQKDIDEFNSRIQHNEILAKERTRKKAEKRKRRAEGKKNSSNKKPTESSYDASPLCVDEALKQKLEEAEVVAIAKSSNKFTNDGSFLDAMKAVRELSKENLA